MKLDILYKDDCLAAINKPHGLMVHRSRIAKDATEFALQLLRDQIEQRVYPVHRLDRKTGGVLLFALNEEMNSIMQRKFMNSEIQKTYLAIVRGFTDKSGVIDHQIIKENGHPQKAVTRYITLGHVELDLPFGEHQTSRYSLVKAFPQTGRMHQIRKHFTHIQHPIIGDRTYGCNKQNKLFKEKWNMTTMLLHASELNFIHPVTDQEISISAPIQKEFQEISNVLTFNLKNHVTSPQ